jgi:hypothetical protein
MSESARTIDSLPDEMIESIRRDAEHFPSYVRHRGREYVVWRRVGPLEIETDLVRATVRGTRNYRTAWRWNGRGVDPSCSCPVGPLCKHAYALALAIIAARNRETPGGEEPSAETRRPQTAGGRPGFSEPARAARPRHEDELEALRTADVRDRPYAFSRLVWSGHDRGIYLSAYEFRDILGEPDADLMCWKLAQEIPRRTSGWLPRALQPFRHRPDLEVRAAQRARTEMQEGLARWAQRHATVPSRSLRI